MSELSTHFDQLTYRSLTLYRTQFDTFQHPLHLKLATTKVSTFSYWVAVAFYRKFQKISYA